MLASKGERKIHDVLSKNKINFIEEYEFKDLVTKHGKYLRFDFAVFDKSFKKLLFLIEMNGKQHYTPVEKFGGYECFKKQQYNDFRKREYCKKHGIKLVIIPYWEENEISLEYIKKKAGYR